MNQPTSETRKMFANNCAENFANIQNVYVHLTHLMAESGFWATVDKSCTEANVLLAYMQNTKPADVPFAKSWLTQYFPLVVTKKEAKVMINGSEVVVKNALKFSEAAYKERKEAPALELYNTAITNRFDLYTKRVAKAEESAAKASRTPAEVEKAVKESLERMHKANEKRLASLKEEAESAGLKFEELAPKQEPVAEALPSIRQVIKTLQKADLSNIAPEERILFDTLLAAVVSHKISLA